MAEPRDPEHHRPYYRGCLLAGAVGDALGAPLEFMTLNQIQAQYGDGGLDEFIPAYGRIGAITDDTQMTLFTAEGLLRGYVRGSLRGIAHLPSVVDAAYQRWLLTQSESNTVVPHPLVSNQQEWLYYHEELHHRRGPGNTCLTALKRKTHYGELADNQSKGCGGVMRVAPAALFHAHSGVGADPATQAFKTGRELAELTHGHVTGTLCAGSLAAIITAILAGQSLSEAVQQARELCERYEGHEETTRAMDQASALASTATPVPEAIRRLGAGWVGEEALAIALYCCLKASTLEQAIVWAANHGGDSDSTAAIAGNIMGALQGVDAIPQRWLEPLELRTVITELADDLLAFPGWPVDHLPAPDEAWKREQERILAKYPGC